MGDPRDFAPNRSVPSDAGVVPSPEQGDFRDSADFTDSTVNFTKKKESTTPSVRPDVLPERTLGRYQLLKRLGRGAFGEVWQAFDPTLNRIVAVKTIRPDRRMANGAADFLQEGRKLAQLVHPGIVTVFDVAESGGEYFIVSQFIEGETLANRLKAGRIETSQAVRIVADVADAIHAAHLRGIVHRDVKPSNILLDRDGTPYLTDFGIAVTEEEQLHESPSTSGTLPYMSPEQVHGQSHHADARSDVYSLGVVLYELLTGRLPFVAQNLDEYRQVVGVRFPRPPRTINDSLPTKLEEICLKALAPHMLNRYSTAKDLGDDLRECLAELPKASTVILTEPHLRSVSSKMRYAVWAMLAVMAVSTLFAWNAMSRRPARVAGDRRGNVAVGANPLPVPQKVALLRSPPVELLASAGTEWQHDAKAELLQVRSHDNSSLIGVGECPTGEYEIETVLQIDEPPKRNGPTIVCLVYGAISSEANGVGGIKWSGESLELRTAFGPNSHRLTRCRNDFEIPIGENIVECKSLELNERTLQLVPGQTHRVKWIVGPTGVRQVWWDGKLVQDFLPPEDIPLPGVTPLIGTQLGVMVKGGTLRLSRATVLPLNRD